MAASGSAAWLTARTTAKAVAPWRRTSARFSGPMPPIATVGT